MPEFQPDMLERAAIASLERFLHWLLDLPDAGQISMFCFRDHKGGLRVSEVGYFIPDGPTTGGGGVWMRSDAAGGAVLLTAEDCLLAFEADHVHRACPEDEPDWLCEARERLIYALWAGNEAVQNVITNAGPSWAAKEA